MNSIIEGALQRKAAAVQAEAVEAARQDLLLLVHRIPYPPNKGDKIRSYNLLKHLATKYRVHLATFVDDADDWQHVPAVEAMCASSHFVKLDPLKGKIRSAKALATGKSLSLEYYRDADMKRWVARTMRERGIARVMMFSSVMAQYADDFPAARRVIDFCDVDSDKWRQYAEKKKWPMSWVYRHEARSLLAYERKVANEFDASLFVSAPEAELFRTLAPESRAKIGHFSNGVDTEYFSPARDYDNPFAAGEQSLVFTGAMDYWPNIDAVKWFAEHVLERVRAAVPGARFYIVGSRPATEVLAMASDAIVVTGTVPDVRPYLAHCVAAVAPLRIARGIQNKVLEAMAMARPVVASPQAFEGIDAVNGHELLVVDAPADYADSLIELLRSAHPNMGRAARTSVERHYSWPAHLSQIETRFEC
ncbi:TIGR03087 family PEP-CTERM/XrtA system glycosyltransferase [Massilia sp. CMS3.1]|uniref:TIGR03087 family PEP-CTERM/XrtA system glycosyltransferase n=1 Tax=Massilia sp. CMS3.1 TaxID=3373083 RepID=UPI003EE8100F